MVEAGRAGEAVSLSELIARLVYGSSCGADAANDEGNVVRRKSCPETNCQVGGVRRIN